MAGAATERLAGALRRHANRHIAAADRHPVYAEVVDTDPIVVELHDGDVELTDGRQLRLTQHVRWYDHRFGIDVGDTLLVRPMPDEDWVATDVISETSVQRGLTSGSEPVPAGASHVDVALADPQPDADYVVVVEPHFPSGTWITGRDEDGFTIHFSDPPGPGASTTDWKIPD